jgi:hypothetical protein
MKKYMKKYLSAILPFLFIISSFVLFTPSADAEEGYRIVRVCSNGMCLVTVYAADGAIVNVYEELDHNP